MHLAASGDVEAVVRALDLADLEGNVLHRLSREPVAQVAGGDVLALLAGERAVVYGEGHLHRRRGDLEEGERLRGLGGADRVAYRDIGYAGKGNDVSGGGLGDGLSREAVELVNADRLRLFRGGVGLVPVRDYDLLVLLQRSALDASDGYTANVLVVVKAGDEHLQGSLVVRRRRGDIVENGIEKGLEVCTRNVWRIARRSLSAGAEEHRAVDLLVGAAELDKKLKALLNDLHHPLVGSVDLVEHHDNAVAKLERL